MIEVRINGRDKTIEDKLTIEKLIANLNIPARTIIVEKNGEVIPREDYIDEVIVAGDSLELIRLTGGG